MTGKEFDKSIAAVLSDYKQPGWRDGQTLFNYLVEHHREEAEAIRGTIFDPFYLDGDEFKEALPDIKEMLTGTKALNELHRSMDYDLQKLVNTYETHGRIIVGLDFDDTIFPLTDDEDIKQRANRIKSLLWELRDDIVLCLWTVDSGRPLKYKLALLETMGLTPDYINESPIKYDDTVKPYFNLLLDDKAGLNEAFDRLIGFNEYIKSKANVKN
jgi:hypothetical protein